jgi:hypothetical protein
LINQYVQQLNSTDARIRREAIIALGKSNDPSALALLAESYRSDPDPGLRDLALKAGRYLKQQMGSDAQPASTSISTTPRTKETSERLRRQVEEDEYDDPPDELLTKPQPPRPKRAVTPQDVTRSKGYIDAALTQNERGENGKAVKLLRQAIELNPDIIKDNYFRSVVSGITNLSVEDAVAFLLDEGQITSFARQNAREQVQKRKSEHIESASETSSWMGVGLEALLYFLINAGGAIIIALVFVQAMQNALNDPRVLNELEMPTSLRQSLATFASAGVAFVILYGILFGAVQTITMFIYGGIVHLAAVFLFQGKGLYRHFMDKILGFYNKRLLVYYGLGLVATILFFAGTFPIVACLSLIIGFFSLWMLFQQMQVTAKAYDFGALGGCLSNVAAGALFVVLGIVLQLALGASLEAAMSNMIQVR